MVAHLQRPRQFHRARRVTDAAKAGVAWCRASGGTSTVAGGRNVNMVTAQRLTDLGRGPTFYDCLVQVEGALTDSAGTRVLAAA